MRQIAAAFAVMIALGPSAGQAEEDGSDLMRRGMELLLEGLQDEFSPALRDLEGMLGEIGPGLRDFMSAMGPALSDIIGEVQDWSVYEPPEILPNGDIIIRRKPEKTPPEELPQDPPEDGQIDL